VRIYKTYGPDAIQVMTENPYRLARDIRGIGFKTSDAIAMKLGIEKTAMVRVRAGISYALTEAMEEGHCGLPTAELIPLAEKLLEVPQELRECPGRAILAAGQGDFLAVDQRRRGLVENDDVRTDHQRNKNLEPLPFANRQPAHQCIRFDGQTKLLRGFQQLAARSRPVEPETRILSGMLRPDAGHLVVEACHLDPCRVWQPICCRRLHTARRLIRSRPIHVKMRRTMGASDSTTSKRATPPP
jgi:hypothetical protein